MVTMSFVVEAAISILSHSDHTSATTASVAGTAGSSTRAHVPGHTKDP